MRDCPGGFDRNFGKIVVPQGFCHIIHGFWKLSATPFPESMWAWEGATAMTRGTYLMMCSYQSERLLLSTKSLQLLFPYMSRLLWKPSTIPIVVRH